MVTDSTDDDDDEVYTLSKYDLRVDYSNTDFLLSKPIR